MVSMLEREELRGEELFIFRRPTSPNWQCRIKFNGLAAFDRSLGTPSKPEAITWIRVRLALLAGSGSGLRYLHY